MDNLALRFHRYFNVLTDHDNGRTTRDRAFRLRYQVYCLETGFENSAAFPDGRERDGFDDHSAHAVITHRDTNTSVATLRLVLPNLISSEAAFPLEYSEPKLLDRHGIGNRVLPRASTGEISRFAVSRTVKRRAGDNPDTGLIGLARPESIPIARIHNSRRCPLLTFGLFLALMRISEARGISHWLACMEPPLLRLLSRFGIDFKPIGGVIEHHGKRQPAYGRVGELLTGVRHRHPELWRLITDDGMSAYSPLSVDEAKSACSPVDVDPLDRENVSTARQSTRSPASRLP